MSDKPEIVIKSMDTYRDGGTVVLNTSEGSFYVDGRINSPFKGHVFRKYGSTMTDPVDSETVERLRAVLEKGKGMLDAGVAHYLARVNFISPQDE